MPSSMILLCGFPVLLLVESLVGNSTTNLEHIYISFATFALYMMRHPASFAWLRTGRPRTEYLVKLCSSSFVFPNRFCHNTSIDAFRLPPFPVRL